MTDKYLGYHQPNMSCEIKRNIVFGSDRTFPLTIIMGARTTIQVITILDKRNSTRRVASAPVVLENHSTCLLAQLVLVVCTLGAVSKKDHHASRE